VPGILATLVAVGLIAGLIARYFGFDILGMVRTVIGGLTARVTGAL
jgi:Flp pilus assembly pilin Flp